MRVANALMYFLGVNSTEGTPDHSTAEYSTSDLSKGFPLKSDKKVVENNDPQPSPQPVVELWVSCGENFIAPEVADQMMVDSIVEHTKRNNRYLCVTLLTVLISSTK